MTLKRRQWPSVTSRSWPPSEGRRERLSAKSCASDLRHSYPDVAYSGLSVGGKNSGNRIVNLHGQAQSGAGLRCRWIPPRTRIAAFNRISGEITYIAQGERLIYPNALFTKIPKIVCFLEIGLVERKEGLQGFLSSLLGKKCADRM